eukprot:3548153-Prorocentrum_lima.AAC.1
MPVDVRVVSVLSTHEPENGRRPKCLGRAARQGATLKTRQYGSDVVPFILEDMGFVATPARALLA